MTRSMTRMSPVQKANLIKTVRAVEDRLNKGWDWLNANPDQAEFTHHEDRWIDLLRQHERAVDALCEGTTRARP